MKQWRAKLVFGFFLLFCALILTKLFYLQVKKGQYFEAMALGQQISFQEIKAERGAILLAGGQPLASTKKKTVIYVIPSKIPESELASTTKKIAEIASIPEEETAFLLKKGDSFKKDISETAYEALKREIIPGIAVDQVSVRFYPLGDLACQTIGFANEEGQGQYGLEGYYNDILQGKEVLRNKSFVPDFLSSFLESNLTQSNKGADIYLTLNHNIQNFSQNLLKQAKENWGFDSAQIIVAEPLTGKILALAVSPSYDINEFAKEKNLDVFLNPTTQKLFEPGSVFKPITMAAGLEEGLVEPDTEYTDTGAVELGGPAIYNFEKKVWGKQTMAGVLENSINTGAIFVEQKLGKNLFLKYIDNFGFFDKTGIDLQGEIYSRNETLKKGYPRDFASASFGQGIQLTSLQLVRAFSALANGGTLVKPYIVEKIIFANGQEKVTQPKEGSRVISKNASAKITAMLVGVVKNASGSRTKIPGYYIAGKSGTAQVPLPRGGGYYEDQTIQSYIGYFPAKSPRFLVFVRMDNPKGSKSAGWSSGPIFKDLVQHIIDLYQIPPDY